MYNRCIFIYLLHNVDIVSLVQGLWIDNCLLLLIVGIKKHPGVIAHLFLPLHLLASLPHCPEGGEGAFTVHIECGWPGPWPQLGEVVSRDLGEVMAEAHHPGAVMCGGGGQFVRQALTKNTGGEYQHSSYAGKREVDQRLSGNNGLEKSVPGEREEANL